MLIENVDVKIQWSVGVIQLWHNNGKKCWHVFMLSAIKSGSYFAFRNSRYWLKCLTLVSYAWLIYSGYDGRRLDIWKIILIIAGVSYVGF